jgi:hypothetical protein
MVAQGYLQGARALGSPFGTNKLYKMDPDCGERKPGIKKNRDFDNTNKDSEHYVP